MPNRDAIAAFLARRSPAPCVAYPGAIETIKTRHFISVSSVDTTIQVFRGQETWLREYLKSSNHRS